MGSGGGLWAAFFLCPDVSERTGCNGVGDDRRGGGCWGYWCCFECQWVVQTSGGGVGADNFEREYIQGGPFFVIISTAQSQLH